MLKQANYVYAETHLSIHTSASVYAKAYTAYTVAPPLAIRDASRNANEELSDDLLETLCGKDLQNFLEDLEKQNLYRPVGFGVCRWCGYS